LIKLKLDQIKIFAYLNKTLCLIKTYILIEPFIGVINICNVSHLNYTKQSMLNSIAVVVWLTVYNSLFLQTIDRAENCFVFKYKRISKYNNLSSV